jgi:hypothetical protein
MGRAADEGGSVATRRERPIMAHGAAAVDTRS